MVLLRREACVFIYFLSIYSCKNQSNKANFIKHPIHETTFTFFKFNFCMLF